MELTDGLPETYPYRDEGCPLAPSCLHCPFPSCLDEAPRGRLRFRMDERQRRMARLHARGKSTRELADMFRVSQRTVQRALARASSRHCEGLSPEAIRGHFLSPGGRGLR